MLLDRGLLLLLALLLQARCSTLQWHELLYRLLLQLIAAAAIAAGTLPAKQHALQQGLALLLLLCLCSRELLLLLLGLWRIV